MKLKCGELKLRFFYNQKEVAARLRKEGIKEPPSGFRYAWGEWREDEGYSDWCFLSANNALQDEPQLAAGLELKMVMLGERVALEQHRHIQLGYDHDKPTPSNT